jgi:hypothetical protein
VSTFKEQAEALNNGFLNLNKTYYYIGLHSNVIKTDRVSPSQLEDGQSVFFDAEVFSREDMEILAKRLKLVKQEFMKSKGGE